MARHIIRTYHWNAGLDIEVQQRTGLGKQSGFYAVSIRKGVRCVAQGPYNTAYNAYHASKPTKRAR